MKHANDRDIPRHLQPPRTPPTPRLVFDKLKLITQSHSLDQKMLDGVLYSLSVTKTIFIASIRDDEFMTAKFLKYFPSSKDYLNYSEITLLGHVLIAVLEFEDDENVAKYRGKIGAHDIWEIREYGSGEMFRILKRITEKTGKAEVDALAGEIEAWYESFESGN